MSAWDRRGIVGASVRRRRSIGAITAIVAIALVVVAVSVGGTVDSVTLQSPKSNSAGVVSDGVAPGALIEANVALTLANNETLDRILVTHDGVSQCLNVSNATGGSVSRTVLFTARGVPGATDVAVRPYNSNDCNSNPVGSAVVTAFNVLAPATNVDFAGSCTSLNIVLVLDESGSITDNAGYVTNVKSAATSFVNALNGTGANLKIVEFDEFATTPVGYTAVTPGNLATFTNYITNDYGSNAVHSTGVWTNWEDALEKANDGTKPDIVVFVTDGNPTAKDGETNFDDGDAEVLDLAFGRANELKSAALDSKASHIYALGVGNALTQANAVTRLKGVSGDTSGSNIAKDDYSIVADFSNLQQTLKDLADQLCSREIKIVKQVDENGDGTFNEDPNVDFSFDVKVTTSAGDVKWLVPGLTTEASPSTKTVTINGAGESTLRFTGATAGATVSATVIEKTPLPTGYEQVGSNCTFTTGQLGAGARVTCTIQNRRKVGTLIVKKVVVNNDGGSLKATDFKFKLDGAAAVAFLQDGGNSLAGKNTLSVLAGSHSVVEDALPIAGYTTTYDNCTNVSVANGETKTCTITNDDIAGTLIVKKVVVNNDGGSLKATDFKFKLDGAAAVAFLQDGGNSLAGKNTLSVLAGSHSVVEDALPIAGYTTTYDNCTNVSVANGETKTCTITNDDIAGTLIVKKVVVNNDGGSLKATDFKFKLDGAAAVAFLQDGGNSLAGKNTLSVLAGSHSVVEDALPIAGYTTTYDNCTNVSVANGETKTCTITNDDIAGTLIVKKVVVNNDGGSLKATDFKFKLDGAAAVAFLQDGGNSLAGKNTLSVLAGSHSVVEDALPIAGYTTTYDNCTNVSVANGETKTCTITNDDIAGTLIVKKVVVNNDGGSLKATDFKFKLDGAAAVAFLQDGGNSLAGKNTLSVLAGSHSVVEDALPIAGYTTTYDNCTNVSVANGETKTCTITNDDIAGTLIVKKVVVNNDGGSLKATDFKFKLDGAAAVAFLQDGGNSLAGKNTLSVLAGSHSVVEDALPIAGYTTTYDNCTNVSVANGETKTCTITNDDIAGTLIVKKVVVNNDGGSLKATDFKFKLDGAAAVAFLQDGGNSLAGKNTLSVLAGSHSVVEDALPIAGYTTTYDNCTNVSVANGETKTCTITNDDIAGTLIVKKVVVNNDGGSLKATDFKFKLDGAAAVAFLQDGGNSLAGKNTLSVLAGSHSVVEDALPIAGYTTTYDNCTNVSVANGETKTCTITNDDIAGTLIVKKVVVNNDGGSKTAGAFTFKVGDGAAVAFVEDGQEPLKGEKSVSVSAGTYTVTEPAVDGYVASYENCERLVIGNGETKTCTITNNDKPGTVIVKKVVVNDEGGTKTAGNFSFKVGNADPVAFVEDGQEPLKGEKSVSVSAGTYTVTEPAVDGYVASYENCERLVIGNGETKTCTITNNDKPGTVIVKKVVVNDNGGSLKATDFKFQVDGGAATSFVKDGDDLHGANTVTVAAGQYSVVEADLPIAGYATSYVGCSGAVANGETKTCTITNDDKAGTLIVKKVVVNDEGGTKTAGNFGFRVGNADPVAFVEDGQEPLKGEKSVSVSAGAYTVTEPAVDGYVASYENCVGIIVGNGETKTCTITNNDNIPPTVDVQKTVRVAGTQDAFAETASAPEASGTFEYRVVVWNKSAEAVSLTALTDTIGAVVTNLDGKGSCSAPQQLAASDGNSGGADTYVCAFELTLTGNAGASQADTVKATVRDDENDTATDEDSASASLTDLKSSIEVTKTADPTTIDESVNSSDVTYTVVVKNTSAVDTVSLDTSSFVDRVKANGDPATGSITAIANLDCDLEDNESDGLPASLDPGASITCAFTMPVEGKAGDEVNDRITVTGRDDDGKSVSDSDDATVKITNVASTITVTKTANPTVVQDSGPVTFTVVVRNDSAVDTVYIQTLTDSIYGNLNPRGTCTLEDGIDEGPAGSRRILPSASYTCSFTETVSKTETDVVTASGVDDDEQAVSDSDDATVTVNRTPPPPYVPSTDISVAKAATPQVRLPRGGGAAAITYNLVVVNNGPDAAANVKVADTAPAGVSFGSATTSAGTCATTAQTLDCTIASLAPGASVAITIKATVNSTGTKVNVVLVTTSTPETNTSNNKASAQTLVIAPLTPPRVPAGKVEICRTLAANPKMLKATGKAQKISIRVTQGSKGVSGVKVKLTGPGISKVVTSGRGGNVKVTIKPSQPGIVRLAIQGKKACNAQRVGVVGVYEPPVTG